MNNPNVKHIGVFSLVRLPAYGKVYIHPQGDMEGGPMELAAFETEVAPWEELGEKDAEKVREFYKNHF